MIFCVVELDAALKTTTLLLYDSKKAIDHLLTDRVVFNQNQPHLQEHSYQKDACVVLKKMPIELF